VTPEEIRRAAWKEFLNGAESALDDWIDEEGEYADLDVDIRYEQAMILQALKREHLR
jgi:hypothetical protein